MPGTFSGFFKRLKTLLLFDGQRTKTPATEKIRSNAKGAYSKEKQKKLEELCEALFEKKELMTTGRLQFLGLGKVKRKLGKNWPGLRPIVHDTVEGAIEKYLYEKDIFIRYKDDTYAIIFAKSDPAEAQVKMTLISDEIRRALFEHEKEELREIGVEQSVSQIKPQELNKADSFEGVMDIIMQERPEVNTAPKKHVEITPNYEIDPYDPNNKLKPHEPKTKNIPSIECMYIPLWDVQKNRLTTYLALPRLKKGVVDIHDNYEKIISGLSITRRVDFDLSILETVKKNLAICAEKKNHLRLLCPVHYETLRRADSHEKYILSCQKIPAEHKKYLVFLVIGLPEKIIQLNMNQYFGALKKQGQALYAQVPLNTKVDFLTLSNWGVDAVGVRVKAFHKNEKNLIDRLNQFSEKAKSLRVPKVFALDIPSLSLTTSAVCSGFDLLGGDSIHSPVVTPESSYVYAYQNLFEDMITAQNNQ